MAGKIWSTVTRAALCAKSRHRFLAPCAETHWGLSVNNHHFVECNHAKPSSSNARYERSVFSYRGTTSTISVQPGIGCLHDPSALKSGLRLISSASLFRGRMCGTYPRAVTTSALPVYPASGKGFRPLRHRRSAAQPWRRRPADLLAVMNVGAGRRSTTGRHARRRGCDAWFLFSPVRGVRPDGFLRQQRFNVRPVCGLPFRRCLRAIVFGEAPAPDRLKQPGRSPLLEAFVAAPNCPAHELFARKAFQMIPVRSTRRRSLEEKDGRWSLFPPSTGFPLVRTGRIPACLRQRRFDRCQNSSDISRCVFSPSDSPPLMWLVGRIYQETAREMKQLFADKPLVPHT